MLSEPDRRFIRLDAWRSVQEHRLAGLEEGLIRDEGRQKAGKPTDNQEWFTAMTKAYEREIVRSRPDRYRLLKSPESKLSGLQKHILTWLRDEWDDRVERYGSRSESWGIPMPKNPEDWTTSDSAGYSRALRRLEERGLLLRQNQSGSITGSVRTVKTEPHDRTTHIVLTEAGMTLAKRLT